MATTRELEALTGVTVLTDDVDIPIVTGLQRQGDIIVIPTDETAAVTPVPDTGTPVVRGENGGNTHAIYGADGPVFCDLMAVSTTDLRVAALTVPPGSVAYLGHPEHGYMGIGPGTYMIRRQREMAEELRIVAD